MQLHDQVQCIAEQIEELNESNPRDKQTTIEFPHQFRNYLPTTIP
jgi:hypothetical protein